MFGNQNMQNDGNKTIKLVLAIGLVMAALIASAGVFYYYVVFVPNLEQQKLELEKQKQIEEKNTQDKILRENKQKQEQRNLNYKDCIADAEEQYRRNWDTSCETSAIRYQEDGSCVLAIPLAERIMHIRDQRLESCRSEAQLDLQ